MQTAIILIKTLRTHVTAVAEQLLDLDGITEVYSVTGDHDLVAVARVGASEQLAALVTDRMTAVEGITDTTTMVAFRHYSRHDLEQMFSLGAE